MTTKTSMTRGGQTYVTPSVEILEVISEGVFCISSQDTYSPADWGTGETGWFE